MVESGIMRRHGVHDAGDSPSTTHQSFQRWMLLVAMIYVLICGVGVIGDGFSAATGDRAREIFAFAVNPFVGLTVGLLATVMLQSSSSSTSIIVALVAGGLPVGTAVPMVMGANIGTTMTNSIVSLGHAHEKAEFRRAFSAATVHDFFNLFAVAVLLPIEILFQPLERAALASSEWVYGGEGVALDDYDFVGMATAPVTDAVEGLALTLGDIAGGIVMVVVGIAFILLSIRVIGRLLGSLMVGRAKRIMHKAVGKGSIMGIVSGATVTSIVQSSTTTTSLMVPFAGTGVFSLREIYPFTLGSNIGTTVTALLAATAVTGTMAVFALEIALVHLYFNLVAIAIIYGLPFLRPLPMWGAEWLGRVAERRKAIALAWIAGVFVALPALLIAVTVFI